MYHLFYRIYIITTVVMSIFSMNQSDRFLAIQIIDMYIGHCCYLLLSSKEAYLISAEVGM